MDKPVSQPFETILVDRERVACDGGGGPLGHPRVFLNVGATGTVECPYCSRVYKLKPGAKLGHGH
ncbi:MAG: zinc-finger domain-containing protein [Gemmatimonas sp.]